MDSKQDNLQRAIQVMGGLRTAQQKLGLKTYQALQQWRRHRVPAEYCPLIERETQGAVRCEERRPDVDWAVLRATDCPIKEVA